MARTPPKLREAAPSFQRETIGGARECVAYRGFATAISTFNGVPIVIMAADPNALAAAVAEINPNIKPLPALFQPSAIVHNEAVIPLNEEL